MALSDDRILRQNPWWTDDAWERVDPHLRRLAGHPVLLPTPASQAIDLADPGIHTLRGPRQVGKSTTLKLLVRRALGAGRESRSVVYVALDLLEDQPVRELARTIERSLELSGRGPPRLVLVDEVTAVTGWQTAVKSLWDEGVIDRDVLVCTGSSAVDLAVGPVERLPGRRQAGRDHLVLPQSFAAFARALDPGIPESPGLSLAEIATVEGIRSLEESRLFAQKLRSLFEKYLEFGGLPAAVAEAAVGRVEPSEETRRILWDSLDRELRRTGASIPALHALLERVVRSLGSKTSWARLAGETGLPLRGKGTRDGRVIRDYVELLATSYFLLVVYFWRPDSDANALSKDKKLYLGDPLLHRVARDHAPGLGVDDAARVENALALALLRRYAPEEAKFEGFVAPGDLHVWGTSRGGEIDFVCGPRERLDALEVKYRRRIDRRATSAVARAFPGRPCFVATRDELDLSGPVVFVPAHLLLWALG